jgi:hypothetical protein
MENEESQFKASVMEEVLENYQPFLEYKASTLA